MADEIDRAQEREEQDRQAAMAAFRANYREPQPLDWCADCTGTAPTGKDCECYAECLADAKRIQARQEGR